MHRLEERETVLRGLTNSLPSEGSKMAQKTEVPAAKPEHQLLKDVL